MENNCCCAIIRTRTGIMLKIIIIIDDDYCGPVVALTKCASFKQISSHNGLDFATLECIALQFNAIVLYECMMEFTLPYHLADHGSIRETDNI